MIDFRSYYQLLEVADDSSGDKIKSAFRRLSKSEHPDKHNNSPEANARFRLLLNAYTILSDPEQREEYDTYLRMSTVFHKVSQSHSSIHEALPGNGGGVTEPPESLISHLNCLLWDIEDFLSNKNREDLGWTYGKHTVRHYLLLILTFIDRWVLEPAGYPDYFMKARQLEKIDPRDYIGILDSSRGTGTHIPYTGVVDYFYDIRKRMDKLLESIRVWELFEAVPGHDLCLIDCIIEAQNLTVHYLSYLLQGKPGSPEGFPPFLYSRQSFVP